MSDQIRSDQPPLIPYSFLFPLRPSVPPSLRPLMPHSHAHTNTHAEGDQRELTAVVQMLAELGVAVAAGGDVEVALDLVEVEAAEDAAAVGDAADARGLVPLGPLAAGGDDVMDVLLAEALVVLLLLALLVVVVEGAGAGAGDGAAVLVDAELVDAALVDPLLPGGGVLLEAGGGEDAVAGGVLHVDVQVLALHAHDHVQVQLHAVPDALLDRERVRLLAPPPPRQLAPHQYARYHRDDDGPLASARRLRHVLGFRLRCRRRGVSSLRWASG